jgi:hypothetical protein
MPLDREGAADEGLEFGVGEREVPRVVLGADGGMERRLSGLETLLPRGGLRVDAMDKMNTFSGGKGFMEKEQKQSRYPRGKGEMWLTES